VPFALGEVLFVPVADEIQVANLIGQRTCVPRAACPCATTQFAGAADGSRRSGAARRFRPHARIGCGLAGGEVEEVAAIARRSCRRRRSVTVYDLPI